MSLVLHCCGGPLVAMGDPGDGAGAGGSSGEQTGADETESLRQSTRTKYLSFKARENKLLVLTSDLYSAINSHLPHLEESYCALKSSTNAALFDDLLREITHSTQAMEEIYCQRVDLSGGAVDVDVTNVYESYLEEINHLRQLVSNVKEQLEEDELSSIEQEIEQTKKKLAEQMSLFNTRRKIKNEKLHDNPQHDAKCIKIGRATCRERV